MKAMIIGIGNIAQVHIKCLKHLGYEIVAICDKVGDKCKMAVHEYDLSCRIYTDYNEMLAQEKADVVHICTPHFLHMEMIIECMKNGLYVFVEKPLAISREQMLLLEEHDFFDTSRIGVCFQNRFSPAVIYVKNLLKHKKIKGAVATLAWDRGIDYYKDSDWKGKKVFEGGSVLINQAIHTIDLIRYLKGDPISVISHIFNDTLRDWIDTEESAFVIFNYDDNTRVLLTATNTSSTYFDVIIQIQANDDCIIIIGEDLYVNGQKIETEPWDYFFGKKAWGTNHLACIKKFYEYVSGECDFPIKYHDVVKTTELLFECYERFNTVRV